MNNTSETLRVISITLLLINLIAALYLIYQRRRLSKFIKENNEIANRYLKNMEDLKAMLNDPRSPYVPGSTPLNNVGVSSRPTNTSPSSNINQSPLQN
jgi:hypothetical protein